MPSHNTYAQYKRDTKHLLYWIINTSNSVLGKSGPALPPHLVPALSSHAVPLRNTTGQTTVAGLVEMSTRIAGHLKNIPSTIFQLFQSVIQARMNASATFQQLAEASEDDLELRTSNEKHKHFIDALTDAFDALGGQAWIEQRKRGKEKEEEEDFVNIIFANKFASLNLGTTAVSESSDEEESPGTVCGSDLKRSRPSRKKAKGKKKTKSKQKRPEAKPKSLDDVPLESYRIIEDHDAGKADIMTEYLFATSDLFGQMGKHRTHTQLLWQEVAYKGLNSAVAAGVADSATSMVRDTVSEIFVDFPGHESYETCMKTFTMGDPSKIDGKHKLVLLKHDGDPRQAKYFQQSAIDAYEHLQVHTFYALRDFLLDFQKNHNGRPTKRMAAEIADWGPEVNLQKATKEHRVQWRRSFTINWLYDLVNQFSVAGWQADAKAGKKHDFAKVDWTSSGPWHSLRRLFGHKMASFAEHITTLAWQPTSVNIISKVLPQHVFQLTCIVDSMAVPRGWTNHPLQGHMLQAPAKDFSSKRDIDLFLDKDNERFGRGWISAVDNVKRGLQNSEMMHGQVGVYQPLASMFDIVTDEFCDFLGEARNVHGVDPLPASRFAATAPNGNGLSEYSLYFCGDGLLEALGIAFHCGMKLWDDAPEPFLAVHLHNMLVERGIPRYIKQISGMWGMCEGIFLEDVFGGLSVPEDKHHVAFAKRLHEVSQWAFQSLRKIKALNAEFKNAKTVSERFDGSLLRVFKTRSFTSALIKADFNIDRVSDSNIRWEQTMGLIRLDERKVVTNPSTGGLKLEDNELVLRARKNGMKDSEFLKSKFKHGPVLGTDDPVKGCQNLPDELKKASDTWYQLTMPQMAKRSQFDEPTILDAIKSDLHEEICGWRRPYLGINYLWGCAWAMQTFHQIEKALHERNHPMYMSLYGTKTRDLMENKRVALTGHALQGYDEEICRVVGDAFDKNHGSIQSVTYWDLEEKDEEKKGLAQYAPEHQCAIM